MKHRHKIFLIFFSIALCMLPVMGWAGEGLGDVADTMVEPIDIAGHLLADTALIAGLVCLIASFFRYIHHRQNPLAYPLSTVVTLLVMGVIFVLFPILYKDNEQPEENKTPTSQVQSPHNHN